jgi:hypothetical protein
MSGPSASRWRVPIIPTGRSKSAENGNGRLFEWVNLQGANKEMEFQSWFDLQLSGIVAMFGKSMEELWPRSQKSQPFIGTDIEPKAEASKSLGLGDLLTFPQKHFNQILRYKNPAYVFEFVGYEKDDPKPVSDLDRVEVDTWKALNEKRAERGLESLDLTKIKNPADLPMNPQVIQAWQSLQQGMGGMSWGESHFDMRDEEGEEAGNDEEADEEEPEPESGADGGWDEIEAPRSIAGEQNTFRASASAIIIEGRRYDGSRIL